MKLNKEEKKELRQLTRKIQAGKFTSAEYSRGLDLAFWGSHKK